MEGNSCSSSKSRIISPSPPLFLGPRARGVWGGGDAARVATHNSNNKQHELKTRTKRKEKQESNMESVSALAFFVDIKVCVDALSPPAPSGVLSLSSMYAPLRIDDPPHRALCRIVWLLSTYYLISSAFHSSICDRHHIQIIKPSHILPFVRDAHPHPTGFNI